MILEITWKLPDNFATEMSKKSRAICHVNDMSGYFDYYKIIVSCVNTIACYIPPDLAFTNYEFYLHHIRCSI